jgi:hypothetical protein
MWMWMSVSTYIALFELLTGKRGWHKTPHGHEDTDDDIALPQVAAPHVRHLGSTRDEPTVVFPLAARVRR